MKVIIDWLKLPGQGVLTTVFFLLVFCAYSYLNFVIESFENLLYKKLLLHDISMHDYSDEFKIRPSPTTGMHDNSDEFEIRPDPTMGMLATPTSYII